ncbi:DUF1707 SHOCT-like domain-containing protein [Trujillonella endophytica]|uniref:DUF1707 domain-containing protein n=1 Tax=Trujillonella endophytica TaxID=673521 RepID=A0A1H8VBU4_9ACTN|nr:DUF1707 domain-containing protein [Trujillella endophytica]SEP12952.1 protein of unknown function [Trujillella endophytica]
MPEPHLRAADADRAAVADLLGRHMTAGRLTVAEYEERLSGAYAAKTYGELDELTTDLPALPAAPAVPAASAPAGPAAGKAAPASGWAWAAWGGSRAAAWASWLSTAVLVTAIWLITCLVSGEWLYPWPIWVVGPWGAVLLAQTLSEGRADPGGPRQLPS